jgi:hypothetical protein
MNENDELEHQPAPDDPEPPEPFSEINQTHEGQESEPEPDAESDAELEAKHDEKAEKKPPTRFQLFIRKVLIGLGIVALIFLAGFLTDHFVRYQPMADTLITTRAELEDANQAVNELKTEVERMTRINQVAQDDIDSLEAELSAVRANALFYQVLMDVNSARIALFIEDVEGAQAALADTQDNLEALLPAINDVDPELALSLPRRLELIVSGLARDPETGLIDLELFTKDLLALEPLLEVE